MDPVIRWQQLMHLLRRRTKTGTLVFTLLFSASLVCATTLPQVLADSPRTWTIECLDCDPVFIMNMGPRSLALDTDGQPRIAFGGDRLYFARWQQDRWQVETVEEGEVQGGEFTSLALDADGTPHITYFFKTFAGAFLRYAVWDGAAWQLESIDTVGDGGGPSALALDDAGNPHVIYENWASGALIYAHRTGAGWQQETVEQGSPTQFFVRHLSLAFDQDETPHIAYMGADRDLRYAVRTGGGWTKETVDADGLTNELALAIDSTGKPRIAYAAVDLRYAAWDGAQWQIQTVAQQPPRQTGEDLSLVLDAGDDPHISYGENFADFDQWALRYTHWDGNAWQTETVDDRGASGYYTSLALDAQGDPAISYFDNANGELRFARRESGVWTRTSVASSDLPGKYTSLAVDADNRPHIAYTESRYENLQYAVRRDGSWQVETAIYDRGNGPFRFPGLTINSAGEPRIVYRDNGSSVQYARHDGAGWESEAAGETPGAFRIAHAIDSSGNPTILYTTNDNQMVFVWRDGAGWHTEAVTDAESGGALSGSHAALALDGQDGVHLAFRNPDGSGLYYATRQGSGWTVDLVDDTVEAGYFPSLQISSNGIPHVAYLVWPDVSTGILKHAARTGGVWQRQTVDDDGYTGFYASLALDGAGTPHIGYYDVDNADLRYAHWTGSSWAVETVDAEGDVGSYLSLAVDGTGATHISYYDDTVKGIKYAHRPASVDPTPTPSPDDAQLYLPYLRN